MVDVVLGWNHVMVQPDCDVCYELGGLNSERAMEYRQLYTHRVVQGIMEKPLSSLKPVIALTVMGRHLPREVVGDRIVEEALHFDEAQMLALAEARGGESLKNRVAAVIAGTDKRTRFQKKHKLIRWATAAKSFVAAMKSRVTDPRVSPLVREQRQISCFGTNMAGERVAPACSSLKRTAAGTYCGECGCGSAGIARLEGEGYTKLDYPFLICPRGREGFAEPS